MKRTIKEKIKGKTILITGGTGSFGNTVIVKLIELSPKRIIIFSRDEKKQDDMRKLYANPLLKFVIGDVRDKEIVEKFMDGVDFVFHAAALKQVPTCEFFPIEAVKTNIFGTHNVISAAIKNKVKRVVVLSTDKAVYPINAMGMTKALMEKIMIAESKNLIDGEKSDSTICGVRYGNVLYSRGSVIPYFVNLIKQRKPLAITNPSMTRFLLPLQDAVNLVLYALVRGKNGCMYVRKSPACTVEVLARAVCTLFKYKIGYEEVGIRAGEKIHETLVSKEESLRASDLGEYYEIPQESQGLEYDKYLVKGTEESIGIREMESYTSENTVRLNEKEVIALLMTLPEVQKELENYKKGTQSISRQ